MKPTMAVFVDGPLDGEARMLSLRVPRFEVAQRIEGTALTAVRPTPDVLPAFDRGSYLPGKYGKMYYWEGWR